jgi:hypothetical protein
MDGDHLIVFGYVLADATTATFRAADVFYTSMMP